MYPHAHTRTQLAKERAAVEAEQRRKDAEAAAIEAAKTPEQRQAELEEAERFAMEQREQGLRLAEEKSRAAEVGRVMCEQTCAQTYSQEPALPMLSYAYTRSRTCLCVQQTHARE